MNLLTHGPMALLGIAFLADVAPIGSCGCDSDPAPHPTRLAITASDCSCASAEIRVKIDGTESGAFTCGSGTYHYAYVTPGEHQVSAQSADGSWPIQRVTADPNTDTTVVLACPTR